MEISFSYLKTIFAAAPHSSFAIHHQSQATKLEILQNRSERADMVLSTHRTIVALSKLDRVTRKL
jgi:hypothetical protein